MSYIVISIYDASFITCYLSFHDIFCMLVSLHVMTKTCTTIESRMCYICLMSSTLLKCVLFHGNIWLPHKCQKVIINKSVQTVLLVWL